MQRDRAMHQDGRSTDGPAAVVERLRRATNAHDLDAVAACFAVGYRNETPAHPARGFCGRERVRRNWEQIFTFVPDVVARVLQLVVDGDSVWSEWEHTGTRPDGSRHLMRGVVIFDVEDGEMASARFYLEPVEDDAGDVDSAVRRQVTPGVTA